MGGVSRKNNRSNNSVKKKFEKGRKVPGLLKKQAKRPLKISFKPCDILTGASLGIFHLGSKPIAVQTKLRSKCQGFVNLEGTWSKEYL